MIVSITLIELHKDLGIYVTKVASGTCANRSNYAGVAKPICLFPASNSVYTFFRKTSPRIQKPIADETRKHDEA